MGYISSVAAINPSPRGASADKELPPEFKHPPNRFKKPAQIESPPIRSPPVFSFRVNASLREDV